MRRFELQLHEQTENTSRVLHCVFHNLARAVEFARARLAEAREIRAITIAEDGRILARIDADPDGSGQA